MLFLTTTSDVIRVVTGSALNVDVVASYADALQGVVTPGRQLTAITTATTTNVLSAPAASTYRKLKFLSIRNKDASADAITVQFYNGSTAYEIIATTLAAGEELVYFEGDWVQVLASGAVKTGFDPSNVAITGGTMTGVDITAKAGTSSTAGLTVPSGTLVTSASAGDFENDGVVSYYTAVNSERGVNDAEQFITTQGGTFTLTSQTAAQKLFNSPSNGSITVGGSRTYLFECQYDLSSMSASSGSFGFALGGTATFTYLKWWSWADKAALATAAAAQSTMNANSTANTTIATATTNTVAWAHIRGILRVNAGGTIIPQVSLGVAAAAVVGRDSYCRLWPLGTSTVTSVGNWS